MTHPVNGHGFRDDVTGRLMKGAKTPRSVKVRLPEACARMAREEGTSLEAMMWAVVKGLATAAMMGDAQCARVLFDRLVAPDQDAIIGSMLKAAMTNGPPLPASFDDYFEDGDFRPTGRLRVLEDDDLEDLLS